MTTEEDFQRALDANRTDRLTHLVFADWLQDRDDERAEGYRALAACGLSPFEIYGAGLWYNAAKVVVPDDPESNLPPDWYESLGSGRRRPMGYTKFESTATARDAAALAFAKLPAERRAELLAVPVLV